MSDKFKSQLETEILDMAYGQDFEPDFAEEQKLKKKITNPIEVRLGAVSACVSAVSLFVIILI